MPITKAELCVTMASILIDVLNLGEQFGIYFAQQAEEIDEMKQRQFFFILLGISAITLLKSIFRNERTKIVISFLIEIGELLSYLLILERTLAVIIISSTFFGLQFVCYIITFSLIKSDDETQMREPRLMGFLCRLVVYFSMNINPLLTLFLNSESRFRQTPYEVSLIIAIFLSSVAYDVRAEIKLLEYTWENQMRDLNQTNQVSPARFDLREVMKNNNAIQRGWAFGNYVTSMICSCFYMITLTVILASLELKEKGSQLPSYDRGICIWFLVSTSFALLLSPYFCFDLGFVIYSVFCR
ncbi:unnamed protein product [Adineta steineri]|uniref:Uncharacterized protein n=1 Tax=Adineta steineri TaxID=433720 RepID=A0A816D9E4_9BILA|nr:unnamed protein product [Adineta steineri]CAF1631284.1 unnamed protein product [Adineta steineri]